jgi:L-ascorbate metabolism protein UlaG (beta-lactamase superfamily)
MVISYLGAEAFKIQFGEITIAYNPVSKNSKLKSTSFGSDIVLVSTNHDDMNGVENASRGDRVPLTITGPGEYETRGVFVHGFPSASKYDGKDRLNTIYMVSLENMNLCFLGALGTTELKNEVLEEIEEIDILFVPIGGDGVLTPAEAYKLAVSLEPKIIVPMHYGAELGGSAEGALKAFLKEGGEESAEKHDKLTIKKKDLEGKEGTVVVINPSV